MLLRALGEGPPAYGHIPLLHGTDGKKLSKRHGAASVQEVRDGGYLPEAVRNYIALLGWGYDDETTFFTTEELIRSFSLERVSKNPAVFDEQKLRWMNGRYLKELPLEDLQRRLEAFYGREIPTGIVAIAREKMQTLADFWDLAGPLIDAPSEYDEKAWEQWGASPHLREVRDALANAPTWDTPAIEALLRQIVDERGVKAKEIFQPIRVALTGTTVSPGIFESVFALGREETLERLDKALRKAE